MRVLDSFPFELVKSVDVELAAVWEKAESGSQRGGVRVRQQGGKHRGSRDRGFTLCMRGAPRLRHTEHEGSHRLKHTRITSTDHMDQRRTGSPLQLSAAREGMVKSGKNQILVPEFVLLIREFLCQKFKPTRDSEQTSYFYSKLAFLWFVMVSD